MPVTVTQSRLSQHIRTVRAFLGVGQKDAAAELGVGYRTWVRWELGGGCPKPETLAALAEWSTRAGFPVTAEALAEWSQEEPLTVAEHAR